MRIALVSREVHPYVGGGIAPVIAAAAVELSTIAEVTVFTSARHEPLDRDLRRRGDPRVLPPEVRLVWVPEEDGPNTDASFTHMHGYSANVYTALRQTYAAAGPDLIEFNDYLAEGFVTAQAVQTADPWLADTLVAVRTHTTSWIAQVLNGHIADDLSSRVLFDLERYVLQRADVLLWQGGDILGTYQRVYGEHRLARGFELPHAFLVEGESDTCSAGVGDDTLRLLFLGRTERRKGVGNLIRALRGLERQDWHLTVMGGDTRTGPLRSSLRSQLQLMAEGDERITFAPAVPRHEVGTAIAAHDVVVIPSLWECWPNVGQEALMQNRPLLATPVGGLPVMCRPGTSGFLSRDTSVEGLRAAVRDLLEDKQMARALTSDGGPRRVFEELTDADTLRRGYRALVGSGPERRRRTSAGAAPLVSVVIPYYRLDEHVRETVESVLRQTHSRVEIVIVNDGCFRPEDQILETLSQTAGARVITQPNSGLSVARNTGIAAARGRYVLPLDADDVIRPKLLERCVDALERDPDLQYVTSWLEYMDESGRPVPHSDGYRPLGNWCDTLDDLNVAGSATALFRTSLFDDFEYHPDLTSYEDWFLYQELRAAGKYGAVIPEYLITYRVRADSMTRQHALGNRQALKGEMAAHAKERSITWQHKSV